MFFINSLRFSIMYFNFICPILWLLSPDALPTSLPTKFCSLYFLAIEALNLSASLLYDSLLCDWLCLVHPRIIKLSTLTGANELKEKDRHPCVYAGEGRQRDRCSKRDRKKGTEKDRNRETDCRSWIKWLHPFLENDAVFGKENREWDALQKHLFPVLKDSGIEKNNMVKKVKGNCLG